MIPIPEDAESYSEESTRTSGYGDSQECLDQPGMLTGSGACEDHDGEDVLGTAVGSADNKKPVEGLCDLAGPDMSAVLHGM